MTVIVIISMNFYLSLLWMLNFQKWMRMLRACLAFLTNVMFLTDWTFIANSFKIFDSTFITGNLMDNFFLFNWNLTLNLTFNWATNWWLLYNFLFDLFNQLGHKLFQFVLNLRLSFLDSTWLFFFFNNFFFFDFRNFWLINNIDEFFLFLGFFGADFLGKFLDLIIKFDLGSLVKEFILSFFDEDFDNFIWGLSHDFEVFFVWKCNFITLIIQVRKLEFFRKFFKGISNIVSKCNQRWIILGLVDVSFLIVSKFKEHIS